MATLDSTSPTILLQISAGSGPREARIFVAALADALGRVCRERKLEAHTRLEFGDELEPRSLALELPLAARSQLGDLIGTHELTMARVRPRKGKRRSGDRKRWFVGVSLHALPLLAGPEFELDPEELEFRFDRAGGPGGQHVNTCASAVRVVHRPTRLAVRVAAERSQHRNRELALLRLASMLHDRAQRELASAQTQRRMAHYEFERGRAVASWRFAPHKDKSEQLVRT